MKKNYLTDKELQIFEHLKASIPVLQELETHILKMFPHFQETHISKDLGLFKKSAKFTKMKPLDIGAFLAQADPLSPILQKN